MCACGFSKLVCHVIMVEDLIGGGFLSDKKVLLIILDGWGLSALEYGNAPLLAKTPVLDYIYQTYPKTSLSASGLEVGLTAGESGNSEVGHLNLGSGRIVWENLPRIDQAIESGEYAENKSLISVLENAKKNDSKLHLIGIVSDGGVHGHIRHLLATLKIAKEHGIKEVLIHFISDGRDTDPKQADLFIRQVEETTKKLGVGRIATMVGRYFAMDRDHNFERTDKAFELIIKNTGDHYENAEEAVKANYAKGKTDEFFEPAVIGEGGVVGEKDSIIFLNYRSDRARQFSDYFYNKEYKKDLPANLSICTMTQYRKNQSVSPIFEPVNLNNALAEIISEKGLTQAHIAETEKFAHVTYFFNAGIEKPYHGEDDIIVPSKKVATYDLAPEMSASDVAEETIKSIKAGHDFIVVNFANGDMVGHSGVLDATVKACESVDNSLLQVFEAASAAGYKALLTADHGNCETMVDELTKKPNKEHTSNPVPFVFLDFQKRPFAPVEITFSKEDYLQYAAGTPIGVLADVAPSILANLKIGEPSDMGGMDLSIAMI